MRHKSTKWRDKLKPCVMGVLILAGTVMIGCTDVTDVNDSTETNGHTEDVYSTETEETKSDVIGEGYESETDVSVESEPEETVGTEETDIEVESEPEVEVELPDPELEGYPELKYDKAGWGLVYGESGAQSRGNEKAKTLAAYNAYYIGNAEDKVIYLTFDCGYENGNTDAILNTLANHDVKATFFVTGFFLDSQKELVKRMADEGHAVGNHSYNHPDISLFTEKEELASELDKVKEKFEKITGSQLAMYFRPPEGKCYSKTLKWSQDMGYATILWSMAHVDWNTNNQPDPEKSLQTLINRTHPGAIVLLHNTSSTNAQILDGLITAWKEMGYTVAPLSQLVGY